MNSIRFLLAILFALPVLLAQAGDSGKTTIQAAAGASPCADDARKIAIQTTAVPGKPDEERKPSPLPALCAADWVAAWQTAKAACPQASGIKLFYQGRSGPNLESVKVFECVDIKAHGELLVITIKQQKQDEESVAIVRASDMIRIEIVKSVPAVP